MSKHMRVSLLYDHINSPRREIQLDIPVKGTVKDVLLAAKKDGLEIGFMFVWLNMSPLNDPAIDISTALHEGDLLHIKSAPYWQVD